MTERALTVAEGQALEAGCAMIVWLDESDA